MSRVAPFAPHTPLKCLFLTLLLFQGPSSCSLASVKGEDREAAPPASPQFRRGVTCAGCVVAVSIVEQLAQLHNSTIQAAMERLCSYMPEELHFKQICTIVVELFGAQFIKLLSKKMNPDVVCSAVNMCHQEPGMPTCHIYEPSQEAMKMSLQKARRLISQQHNLWHSKGFLDICSLPYLSKICQKIEFTLDNNVPLQDFDGDNFSVFPSFRGYDWRGKDCDERDGAAYPGRRPDDWDAVRDSNCNGIMGIDPDDGIPYEKKFCEGTESRGIILLGDSAGAHFHIPPEWMTVQQMSAKSFSNLPLAVSNELNWPHYSAHTGFEDSKIGGWTDSIYLRLRNRNRCNHRDYQNLSKNGGDSSNLLNFLKSMARKQAFDKPAVVVYELIGNDVCNCHPDTLAHMTTPAQMHSNVMEALEYLNAHLPNGSHVLLSGLVDGRFLWDHLHNRFYPLGQLNKDITYEQAYSFLSCLQINSCQGWMSANETLRNLTSERASKLSSVLKEIAASQKFDNFDIHYLDYPLGRIADAWKKQKGEGWQLIEPVDGFHPNQIAHALQAEIAWQEVSQKWPQVLGRENPFNAAIEKKFGNQGGH
ncbi:acyloxyacyl hydrolase [Ambystoma mexicanum]|uniref:acyloxyacyl hydrolase n=1 Tax=Ambystoma mexicanum TaxID=8296 RepID=UPI0037E764C3